MADAVDLALDQILRDPRVSRAERDEALRTALAELRTCQTSG